MCCGSDDRLLTWREKDVARLMARGLTPKEIASELSISRWTVYDHEKRIKNKLQQTTRGRAAARLRELKC